ncbi:hypothetical protein SAMD00023353_2900250 [Rosellinia necatrix]|uniref:Uncharacterized protein n=1 Tax=Rosellinia necatrix TaxID=77044 RepID=A0A1W2TJG2_ROSNE|nr:hypothetical protein SAMD00023353_2900250 [Rosellinia necatrix]
MPESANATAAGAAAGAASIATSPTAAAESPAALKASAAKDRNCPYCGQAFTSSSLGRHLDLYIKEKNPKPPDGIHDVDAIRKMRESITRRQPRGSLARRDLSNPGTPASSSRKSPAPSTAPDPVIRPPAIPKEGQFVVDHQTIRYPFQPSWEATGVINDIPQTTGDRVSGSSGAWEGRARASPGRDTSTRPQNLQRAPSRTAQKMQLDTKQRLADAMDTARAAELALRELLSSIRAAKQHVDMNSLPFDFDPLALDFPALTLQCLKAPPTLFSSTPHPTSTSWSIQPPGQKQHEALQMYFRDEFDKWRVACATATTISTEELTYPPSETNFPRDMRESVKKAEKVAALLEKQVHEHLQSTYQVWEQLTPQRRGELWGLELARSVGRRQKEIETLKEAQYANRQENANLKTQVEQLNHLQQPREYRIMPPATIPIEETFMNYLLSLGASGVSGVGVTLEERHVDLNTMVSRAIDRWKSVIISTRSAGMGGQKLLDQVTPTVTPTGAAPVTAPPPSQRGSGAQPHHSQRPLALPQGPPAGSSTTTAAPSAADEENSDEDADADMDEGDDFAPMVPPIAKAPAQIQPQLEVSRTRGHGQRGTNNTNTRFMVNGNNGMNNRGLSLRRSIPSTNAASPMTAQRQLQQAHINSDEYATSTGQGVVCDDPMYMD